MQKLVVFFGLIISISVSFAGEILDRKSGNLIRLDFDEISSTLYIEELKLNSSSKSSVKIINYEALSKLKIEDRRKLLISDKEFLPFFVSKSVINTKGMLKRSVDKVGIEGTIFAGLFFAAPIVLLPPVMDAVLLPFTSVASIFNQKTTGKLKRDLKLIGKAMLSDKEHKVSSRRFKRVSQVLQSMKN